MADECIKTTWNIYTMEYHISIKKKSKGIDKKTNKPLKSEIRAGATKEGRGEGIKWTMVEYYRCFGGGQSVRTYICIPKHILCLNQLPP